MKSPPVKIIVAGATGLIGKRHLQHVVEEDQAELVGIIDCDATAANVAEKHQVPLFKDVGEFVHARSAGSTQAQAVILATPTHTHVPLAKQLIELGVAVLVEKPVAVTGEQGKELIELCRIQGGAVVMVGHHRRHNVYGKTIKKVIDSGQLGKIIAVNGVWAMHKPDEYFSVPWRQQVGSGGVTLTNAIHEIDMLQYWLGEIVEVYSLEGEKQRSLEVDATVQTIFKFSSGAVGSFLFTDAASSPHSWEAATGENPTIPKGTEPAITFFGSNGSISVPSLLRYHYDDLPENERNWTFPMSKDESLRYHEDSSPPFTEQLKHFIASVRGEVLPNCSLEDGVKAVLVVEAIFKSLQSRTPIHIEGL